MATKSQLIFIYFSCFLSSVSSSIGAEEFSYVLNGVEETCYQVTYKDTFIMNIRDEEEFIGRPIFIRSIAEVETLELCKKECCEDEKCNTIDFQKSEEVKCFLLDCSVECTYTTGEEGKTVVALSKTLQDVPLLINGNPTTTTEASLTNATEYLTFDSEESDEETVQISESDSDDETGPPLSETTTTKSATTSAAILSTTTSASTSASTSPANENDEETSETTSPQNSTTAEGEDEDDNEDEDEDENEDDGETTSKPLSDTTSTRNDSAIMPSDTTTKSGVTITPSTKQTDDDTDGDENEVEVDDSEDSESESDEDEESLVDEVDESGESDEIEDEDEVAERTETETDDETDAEDNDPAENEVEQSDVSTGDDDVEDSEVVTNETSEISAVQNDPLVKASDDKGASGDGGPSGLAVTALVAGLIIIVAVAVISILYFREQVKRKDYDRIDYINSGLDS